MSTEPQFLPPDPSMLEANQESQGAEPTASPVGDTLASRREMLMHRPGVVMVGETIDVRGRAAILIGVRTPGDLTDLPTEIDGIPIVTQVIGEVDAL
jgi:hypothetical protein